MLRHVAVPFVYLIEKRYFVCADAMKSYFDSAYNAAIDARETWSPEAPAEKFYAGPEELIAAFAEAYRIENEAADCHTRCALGGVVQGAGRHEDSRRA